MMLISVTVCRQQSKGIYLFRLCFRISASEVGREEPACLLAERVRSRHGCSSWLKRDPAARQEKHVDKRVRACARHVGPFLFFFILAF